MVRIMEKIERGASKQRTRPAALLLRPHPRQVPVPARRRGGDAGRELRRQVPRRIRRHVDDGACPCPTRRSTDVLAPRRPARPRACPRLSSSRSSSTTVGSRFRKGRASSRRRSGQGSRSPSSVRAAPRPAVGACRMCVVRSRQPEAPGGLHADRTGGEGVDRADLPPKPPRVRTRPSRPSSSTIHSTAACATRRRVPVARPDVPLRPGSSRMTFAKLTRQADPDLSAHRARPRALHPLVPLHALLRERRGGRGARRGEPRRAPRSRRSARSPIATASRAT